MTEPHSPRKLLVVDDDPFVHRQVRHIVGREFAVTSILSTNKVTNAMLESLDTLVLDLNLPDGDAIGFMQDMGARPEHAPDPDQRPGNQDPETDRLGGPATGLPLGGDCRQTAVRRTPEPLLQAPLSSRQSTGRSAHAPMPNSGLSLEQELHRALARNEFLSHFQPQYDLSSGLCTGAEALCRWAHPRLGLLGPGSIIEALEGGPLGMAFSLYMLDDAIERFKAATAGTGFCGNLSVNVPVSALESPRLANLVQEILLRHDFPAPRLTVEITERGISRDAASSSATIASLRIRSVRISLDDFGTGYSSFKKLKDLAVDEIKIDKHFVADVIESRTSQTLVQAAISIADEMGLQVVAEGIETREIASWLAAQGHLHGQGYLYARPLDPSDFRDLLLQLPQDAARSLTFTGPRTQTLPA